MRAEVEREVDEAEHLHDAERRVVGLLERAGDEVDRTVEFRGIARFELRGFARRVARRVEQRDHLARDDVDRRRAGVRVRQVFVLVTLAGHRVDRAVSRGPIPC